MYERVPGVAPCEPRAGYSGDTSAKNSVDVSLSVDESDAF